MKRLILALLVVFVVLSLLKISLRSLSPVAVQAMAEASGPRPKRLLNHRPR